MLIIVFGCLHGLKTFYYLSTLKQPQIMKIRTYGRTELAQLYCPHLTAQAAYRKLQQWIDLSPGLRQELLALTLNPKARTFTPMQVQRIMDRLGEP